MNLMKLALLLPLLFVWGGCKEKQNEEGVAGASGADRKSKLGELRSRSSHGARTTGEVSKKREKARTALDAAKSISSPVEREQAIAQIGWEATEHEPEIVERAIEAMLPGTPERQDLIRAYILITMHENPDGIISWAASLGDSRDIAAANEEIADNMRSMDPEKALGLLPEGGPSSEGMSNTATMILQNWAAQDSAKALAWVGNLKSGVNRDMAFTTVFDQLVQTDPTAAFEWAKAQVKYDAKTKAVEAIAKAIAEQPPEMRESILESADSKVGEEVRSKLIEILPPGEVPVPENISTESVPPEGDPRSGEADPEPEH